MEGGVSWREESISPNLEEMWNLPWLCKKYLQARLEPPGLCRAAAVPSFPGLSPRSPQAAPSGSKTI